MLCLSLKAFRWEPLDRHDYHDHPIRLVECQEAAGDKQGKHSLVAKNLLSLHVIVWLVDARWVSATRLRVEIQSFHEGKVCRPRQQ